VPKKRNANKININSDKKTVVVHISSMYMAGLLTTFYCWLVIMNLYSRVKYDTQGTISVNTLEICSVNMVNEPWWN